ncbi:MAG: PKD domain-containing protein, partial [Bacteroidia bacterium]
SPATLQGEAVIEGGVGTIYGGGPTPNDDDSSGVIRYVRIEFPGIPFQPNSEINGLTLGGVGRKTLIENVMISYCGDDSFEMFGGTVNLRNIIAYRGWDDDFDTDFGYSGNVQFAIAVRDPAIADQSGSNGFESDNDASGTANTPNTAATFSNVTIIGPLANSGTINSNYTRALHLRRNTRTSAFNSVFVGYPVGLLIDGSTTQANATSNALEFKNSVLCQMNDTLAALSNGNNVNGAFNITTWFNQAGFNNQLINSVAQLGYTNTSLANPDLRLTAGSPLASGSSFSATRLSNPFFQPTTYIGAMGTNNWTACWAEWDPQNEPYNQAIDNSVTATITPSGTTTFCQGNSVNLDANTIAGATYLWSNGATTPSINVTSSGNYSVTITNSNGCSAVSSPVAVTVNPLPSVSITASGPTTLCTGGSVDLTSSQTGAGNTWSTGATTNMINVNTTGTYSVTFVDVNGCSSQSNAINVNISAAPQPTIATTGSTTICAGQSVTLTASASDSYQWNLNGSPISGAVAQTYVAIASGNYTVTVTNVDPCDGVGTSDATAVFVNPTPTAAFTYTINGNTVSFTNNSLGATSYNWTFGDGNTSNLPNPSNTYSTGGNYTVTLTATAGSCSDVETINITSVSVEEVTTAIFSGIILYPNPSNQMATLEVDMNTEGDVIVEVLDLTGKVVASEIRNNVYTGKQIININSSEIANGLYLVSVRSGEARQMIRMVVQH